MGIAPELLGLIEQTANRLAGEAVLATAGRDEGLIPSYSLLADLRDLIPDEAAALRVPCEQARAALDARLESGQPFDEASLGTLVALVQWLPLAIAAAQRQQDLPPFVAAPAPVASAAAAAPAHEPAVDQILQLDLEYNRELLTEFHAEAAEHLEQIEAGMLALEAKPGDPEALNAVFRSFHTIKGNSGFLGLTPMNALAHEVETLLDLARCGQRTVSPAVVTQVLRSRDALLAMNRQVGHALESGAAPAAPVPVQAIIVAVKALIAGQAPSEAAAAPEPAPAGAGEAPEPAAAGPGTAGGQGASVSSTVRVSTGKLDNLMDVVGELVIVQSQLAETARRYGAHAPPLAGNVGQLNRITKELQHTAMSLRMIPIQPTFQKMERLARDLLRDVGKQAAFATRGGDTELDRTMVEEIADPLVHMVRNAIDHGIEPEEERRAKGKAPAGLVELRAFHQGGSVIIELRDDGRGLDPEKILAKARRQGLVAETASPTVDEIYRYIFLPGFSTAAQVTALSGRGVGMDVVKRNVERLRGKIEIASAVGRGTTFTIKLPLTMAIIDGLVVRVGDDRFILPTTSVQRALRPTRDKIVQIQGNGEVLDLDGKLLPLHRLNRHFGIPAHAEEPWEGILVVVETNGKAYALLVDEMISKQEVVIKNLGAFVQSIAGGAGVAGGAILGDGRIALILDPTTLLQAA